MAGQWLTADEQRAWRAYLRAGTLLRARLNRQLQADSGLSLPEYEVLVQLSEGPGGRLRRAAWVVGEFADEGILGMLATDWARDGKGQAGKGEIPAG